MLKWYSIVGAILVALAIFAWAENHLSEPFQRCIAQEAAYQPANNPDKSRVVFGRALRWEFVCSVDFLDKYNGFISALAAVAIAVFTYTLYKTSAEQARLTRAAVELGNKEFVAAHPPLIRIRHLRFQDRGFHQGDPLAVEFEFRNVGGSTAKINSARATIVIRGLTEELRPRFGAENTIKFVDLLIEPGDGDLSEAKSDAAYTPVEQSNVTLVRWHIFVVGDITYEDVVGAGITRRTGFCRRYVLTQGRFVPEKDSDYEYAD